MLGRFLFLTFLMFGFVGLLGCESDEADDLAQAQRCLDRVPQDDGSSALSCLSYIAKYNNQQSHIIRCSAYFLAGGLTTNKIVEAYKALEDDNANKEAIFIGALALTDVTTAQQADSFCRKTGLKGFIYLGSLAVVGTILKTAGSFASFPPTQSEVQAALDTCAATPSSCEPAAIAAAATTLADTYCSGSAADETICQDITAAIDAGAGSTENVTIALTCLLNNKTFTPPSTCT